MQNLKNLTMQENDTYIQFVQEAKQQILQSRYQAAKLVNKELLFLYFNIGKMIFEKVKKEKWGNAIIENLSKDIQTELPGLRGFSSKNLRNMRLFYEAYRNDEIWQLVTAKFQKDRSKQIGQSSTAKIKTAFADEVFIALSFTHHVLLLNKFKDFDERFFYMQQAASNHWTVNLLQHHIEGDLYHQKGSCLIILKRDCR
jgi:predicted nuclease of restriction endonuclease-like (RecB) superfamily